MHATTDLLMHSAEACAVWFLGMLLEQRLEVGSCKN
jgi:hypothetical protein